ncbi:hypothetical protein ACS0TY_035828 [Phlomoides rotata]
MDFVNLSAAYNWAQVITSLPSLVELHFQACSLEYIAPLDYVNSTTLKHLYIADNNFRYKSSISIPRWIFQLNNLLYLDLSNNSFVGSISTISNATKLRHIDLSDNHFYSSIPHWFYLCKHLEFVDLSLNSLSGTISNSVANLTSLNTLRVTSNQLSGKIPKEIVNLCKIQRLDLSDNFFQGEISDSFGNMSECFLESLQHLRLRNTALSGHLPNQFGDFKSLRYLNLGVNSLSGAIPISLGKLSSLEQLWLHANKFTGTLPESFGLLSSLQKLFMNDNMLEGVVTEAHFANLTKLDKFFATGNHLTLNVSPNWNPPFNLTTLRIMSWSLGPVGSQIPVWLETQKNIRDLDLSNTGISGSIPSWVWKVEILTLSHNNLSGKIPDLIGLKNKYIYLGSNQFSGSLPRVTGTLRQLDLSNNSFSGGVSHLLCDTRNENYNLSVLNLGGNQLIGELPDCWMKWPSLKYLNLGNNNMSGSIPNSIGHLAALQSLNLYGNRLSGAIPFSMHNCTELVKIDFRDNNLDGGLPTWVGTELLKLAFLVLGSNKLSGSISSEICHLNSLQILDLSGNEFLGVIPRCVYNFTGMATERNYSRYKYSWWVFIDSVLVDDKGSEFEYGTTLSLVTNINLSKNNLSGDIPKGLTSLAGLRSLNLSRNRLTGSIPERIGDMKQLESLDLSINSVSGEIPSSFTILTFLNHLNLSHNNLSGRIPKSTQLQSLDASSFTGNNLCGSPLEINCSGDVDEPHRHKDKDSEDEGENESKIEWFYVLLSLGYAVGLSVVCTTLVLKKSWREGYFRLLDSVWDKFYVVLNLGGNQLSGELPDCWVKWPSLIYLNLGNNNMPGSIPNSIGHLAALQSLNLYGNRLSGAIPFSMHNCTELVKIDFRDNDLDGGLPTWVGTELLKLTFLVLGTNKLSGSISSENQLLSLVTNINLSKNNLFGDIPKELTSLAELRSLNLSRNRLTGSIPKRIGDMKQLESLDLSINSVSGEIPSSYTLLTSLNHLNLSHNNLTRRIPKSTQLQSLDASSFTGNNLCGSPSKINCRDDDEEPRRHKDKNNEDEGSKIEGFYVLLSLGYAVGFSLVYEKVYVVSAALLNVVNLIFAFSVVAVCSEHILKK